MNSQVQFVHWCKEVFVWALVVAICGMYATALLSLRFLIIRNDAGGLVRIGDRHFDISWEILGILLIVLAGIVADICAFGVWRLTGRRYAKTLAASLAPLNLFAGFMFIGLLKIFTL